MTRAATATFLARALELVEIPAPADPATGEPAAAVDAADVAPAGDEPTGTDPAGGEPAGTDPATDEPTRTTADPAACRPRGTPYTTAGFPLPEEAAPSIGTMRVAVLFLDFPDVRATYTTQDEAALGLPYAEEYLEAASYGRIDVEFVPLHGWLRAGRSVNDYLQQYAIGESRVAPSAEAIGLADPSFDFTGIHAVMTVLPSSRFQAGNHTLGLVQTDEKAIRLMAEVNTAVLDEPRDPAPWGPVAAHELAHSLGLSDLYPYDAARHELPEAPSGRIWVRSEFGLMGLNTSFVAHPEDRRIEITGHRPSGRRLTGRHLPPGRGRDAGLEPLAVGVARRVAGAVPHRRPVEGDAEPGGRSGRCGRHGRGTAVGHRGARGGGPGQGRLRRRARSDSTTTAR